MSRGGVEGLKTPVPLGTLLPAIYQEHDPNMMVLTEIIDEMIAPIWLVLDNMGVYLEPQLAPTDFVSMIASWVGVSLDPNWTWDQRRAAVAGAVETFQWEGTKRAVVAEVEAYCGVTPFVSDSGGVSWSATSGGAAPGSPEPAARVQIDLPADRSIDLPRLQRLIERRIPAHIPLTLDVRRV